MQVAREAASSGGLSPTLSIVVPVLAGLVGALAGGVARYVLDQYANRAEMRGAVRLMRMELDTLAEVIGQNYGARDLEAAVRVWPSVRSALAMGLSTGQWDALVAAMYYVEVGIDDLSNLRSARIRARASRGDDHEQARGRFSALRAAVPQALNALDRFEEHGRSDKWTPEVRAARLAPKSTRVS